jgi:sodium/bile acid cotransporter 7
VSALLRKHWFFVGMAAMVAVAFGLPDVGRFMKVYHILDVGIFLAFLVTGLTLETASILRQLRNVRVLVAALASSLLAIPILAYVLARLAFPGTPDFVIGALIIGAAPVTIASGTVMTAIALGNVPLSLFICVLGNFASILSIPFLLNLILQMGGTPIELPAGAIFMGLVAKVLVPTVIGQLLRPWLKQIIAPYKKAVSIFNQSVVLLIILNAVSSSAQGIRDVGPAVAGVLLFMAALHALILLLNFGLARLIRLDRPSTAAFTIHTSQKTLTISYLVWAGYFATDYPMALIPGIAYHMTQMIMDTIVAHRFREKAATGE